MNRRDVLTKAIEKHITEDWQRQIPSLSIYRPRWLRRRVGALVMGICLDRDSSGEIYKPIFHVHCLCVRNPVILLTLATQLRDDQSGGPSYVEVRWHSQQYMDAVSQMIEQTPLPLDGDLRLSQIIDADRAYMESPLGQRQIAILSRDMILLSAWAGDQSRAWNILRECQQYPESVGFRNVGGQAASDAECSNLIENPALVQQNVDSQVASLCVDHLPASSLAT